MKRQHPAEVFIDAARGMKDALVADLPNQFALVEGVGLLDRLLDIQLLLVQAQVTAIEDGTRTLVNELGQLGRNVKHDLSDWLAEQIPE